MLNDYSITISTFPDIASAKNAAKMLVERRLAACVQVFPIESVYCWKDEICEDGEVMLFIKSRTALFEAIATAIKEIHSYEVPEVIQVPITGGLLEYLGWIDENTEKGLPGE